MKINIIFSATLVAAASFVAACGDDASTGSPSGGDGGGATTDPGSGGSGGAGGSAPSGPACTKPTPVACEDEIILGMNLQKDPAAGAITSAASSGHVESKIDATAGGAFTSQPTSYTYGKFKDGELTKVAIGDEDSLESMDWDIAFRRYVVRINSGDSGPSCVTATPTPAGTDFDALAAVPSNASFHTDDYFTDDCTIISDGTGLPNSPATALSGFWEYPGCVKMTGDVYILQIADGRYVKLVVDDYYAPDVQTQCNETGAVSTTTDTGSGNYVVRWAFL
jgi:hypothetical protein